MAMANQRPKHNITHSPPHPPLLHSHSSSSQDTPLHNAYGTTLVLIILLHFTAFLQWNRRRSRQEVSTSYAQLVDSKQFYRIIALASHPPVEGGERDSLGNDISLPVARSGGDADGHGVGGDTEHGHFGRVVHGTLLRKSRAACRQLRQRLLHGSWSALPLLTYVSHVLWQCRALEELYDEHDGVAENVGAATEGHTARSSSSKGHSYFRVLVALGLTSLLVELALSRSMLRRIDQYFDSDGSRTSTYQRLSQRAMCSLASLATALLTVYDSHFPHTPPAVLPFVRWSLMSLPGTSLLLSMCILTLLARRIHSVTSIISGLMGGSLWCLGLTSFLGTRYWGDGMLFVLLVAMLLSLKAQPSYAGCLGMLLPCLDYVSWDSKGIIPSTNTPDLLLIREDRRLSMVSGNEERWEHAGEEHVPLTSSPSSSIGDGGVSAIRGRVPLTDTATMDSDSENAQDSIARNSNDALWPPRHGVSLSRRTNSGSQAFDA